MMVVVAAMSDNTDPPRKFQQPPEHAQQEKPLSLLLSSQWSDNASVLLHRWHRNVVLSNRNIATTEGSLIVATPNLITFSYSWLSLDHKITRLNPLDVVSCNIPWALDNCTSLVVFFVFFF